MNIFKAVKQSVTTRQAAEHYGIKVSKKGMALCPFHNDRNPSMKVDNRFYCFACGATGDVIDFVSRLYGLGGKDAALRLSADFAIPYENGITSGQKYSKPLPRQKSMEQQFAELEQHCFKTLATYYHRLKQWKTDYSPVFPEIVWHPLFAESLKNLSHVEYLLDILLEGEIKERAALVVDYGKEMMKLERRMAELAAADAASRQRYDYRDEIILDC